MVVGEQGIREREREREEGMRPALAPDDYALVEHLRQALLIAERLGPPAAVQERLAALTQREREVWRLLARGALNKEIAHELGISPQTVKNHVTAVFTTLGVGNRAAASTLYGAFCGAD